MELHGTCAHCGKEVALAAQRKVARKETCPSCSGDLHCCKNCQFFSPSSYNGCSEPNAERVVDKERSNFCDYFAFRGPTAAAAVGTAGGGAQPKGNPKDEALKRLEDLFKKS